MNDSLTNAQKMGRALTAGDWLQANKLGYLDLVYVIHNNPASETLLIGNPKHLVSDAHAVRYAEIDGWIYIGRTKRREWLWLIPWRDIVCPFEPIYHKQQKAPDS